VCGGDLYILSLELELVLEGVMQYVWSTLILNFGKLIIKKIYYGFDLSETLTRARFEELNIDLFKKIIGPSGRC